MCVIENGNGKVEMPDEVLQLSDRELKEYLAINGKIEHMNVYGKKKKYVDKDGYILYWSNGSKSWYIGEGISGDRDTPITLDANEMYVPFERENIEKYIEYLRVLPLYFNSMESNMSGDNTTENEHIVQWVRNNKKLDYKNLMEVVEI